jgi:hypothetical protein
MNRGVLCAHIGVGSWIANTNHISFFNHYVLGGITVLFEDCNYKNEKDHNTIVKGGNFIV